MNLRWAARRGIVLLLLAFMLWLASIWRANEIARHNFGPEPCWFVHAVPDRSPPRLMPGPNGFYLPNPFRQLNRRFVGLGIKDPEVLTPHFAVAALDTQGHPTLWGWSYVALDFWPLSAADDAGAFYDSYTDREAIRVACPRLRHASPAYAGKGGLP